jgi:hypothetical protein
MSDLIYLCWWLINVLLLSSSLALFEIILERENGWASGLKRFGLGRPLWRGSLFANFIEKQYLTPYHLLMFGVVIPGIFLGQLYTLHRVLNDVTFTSTHSAVFSTCHVGPVAFVPLLAILAAWLALAALEDFLWFAWNWYYPRSLQDLIQGQIWWHTQWVQIGTIKLPRFYVVTPPLACVLLAASSLLAR